MAQQQAEEMDGTPVVLPTLIELAARVVANGFTKSMVGTLPLEVMDAIQKQMPREKQVEYLGEYKEW